MIEKSGLGHNVEVDVFKVSSSVLNNLDRLEGHPIWYKRKQIEIKMKDGRTLTCWIYFNIKEDEKGKEWHKTYTQYANRLKFYEEEDEIESAKQEPSIFAKYGVEEPKSVYSFDLFADDCEDCGFDIENEKPVCIDCYHDLEHDGFVNYYCSGCNSWFAEDEVLAFKP